MSFSVSYLFVFIAVSIIWIIVRVIIGMEKNSVDILKELKLLTLYVCLVVIVRITFFPWNLIDGHIQPLIFDSEQIFPPKLNLIPIIHLFDEYDGWLKNLFGNITMFIPVGMALPFCFNKLDNIGKVTLSGFLLSLCIELLQLPFFDRTTDIDDLITNTTGAFIGAVLYFLIRAIVRKQKHSA